MTGAEILPSVLKEQDKELLTYSRRNHTRSKRPTIPLAQGQPDTLSEESERNTDGVLTLFWVLHRYPGTGEYDKHFEEGIYNCSACGTPLYKSTTKFNSGCGWPAFYEGLPGAINCSPDPDGLRIEITCAACGGHLGHVFKGEGFPTPTDERHCPASFSNEARLLLALIIWEWVTIVAQRHFGDFEITIIDINCYEGGTSFDVFYYSTSALSNKLLPIYLRI
ncbi:hypothetical protein WN943_024146 [Citrus x changshan-huyou]